MDMYDRIKALARENGTTIEDALLSAGNISLNTYNGWKKRKVFPRADEALKIAKQFDVSVEYLLTGCSSGNDFSPRVQKIAEECERASDLELTMVEKILDISPPGKNTGVQMTS